MRSGRCRDWASSIPTSTEAYRAAVDALKHPAAGVRKAAAMVLPHTPEAGRAIMAAGLLHDPDLHTRLAAALAVADMPTSAEIGPGALHREPEDGQLLDKWLSRAFYIAAMKHQKSFTAAYHADRNALPYTALPIAVRLGNTKPDWRMPATAGRVKRLGRHGGARQLGVARPSRFRRRRLVHTLV